MEEEVISWREKNRAKILRYFGAAKSGWNDYLWHLKHIIRDPKPLLDLPELTNDQKEAIDKANKHNIPSGITPYYLSLMDYNISIGYDHAIRTQVIPAKDYVDLRSAHKIKRDILFDFMGEQDTSPIDLVTRRYPFISIFKPFNTCSQICVYCQRNWEIQSVLDPEALASKEKIDEALSWFDDHQSIGDILITGGDPLVMKDDQIRRILEILAAKKQIYRIRTGTRTPVALPMRWTEKLLNLISKFHNPPKLEITIVTHFEHSYEITPESMEAVQKIRRAGMSVYNQVVFTIENSRRFELSKLRWDLKSIGVDPYYTFNMKGKEETDRYMVPIARIFTGTKRRGATITWT